MLPKCNFRNIVALFYPYLPTRDVELDVSEKCVTRQKNKPYSTLPSYLVSNGWQILWKGIRMQHSKSLNRSGSQQNVGKVDSHHKPLRDAIINRLENISRRGEEQVLEYILELTDREEQELEFDRRQGRLYGWPLDDVRL